jgi:5-methylcytosine-specific restriction endonuclease McrA
MLLRDYLAQKRAGEARKVKRAIKAPGLWFGKPGTAKGAVLGSNVRPGAALEAGRGRKQAPRQRKRLKAQLDAFFSILIRRRGMKRTGGKCELCGKRPIEVCFHFVSRGSYATRWDTDNAVASCRGCNFEETFRKQKYRDIHISKVGLQERERLEAKARGLTHFTIPELKQKLEDLKRMIQTGI